MARKKKSGESESPDERTNLSDDTFGLPEIHYEPIRKDEEKPAEPVSTVTESSEEAKPEQPVASETESTYHSEAEETPSHQVETEQELQSKPEEQTYSFTEERSSPLKKTVRPQEVQIRTCSWPCAARR